MKNILKELIDGKISISDAEDKLKSCKYKKWVVMLSLILCEK